MSKILILWGTIQAAIFGAGFFLQKNNGDLRTLNKIGLSVLISRGAGMCLAIIPVFMVLPMCKKSMSFIGRCNRYIFQYLLSFHKITSITLVFFALIHSASHFVNFYIIEQSKILKTTMFNIHYKTVAGITGNVMMISIFFISCFSIKYFIKNNYNLFAITHNFYVLFFIAYIFHGTGCFVKGVSGICYPYYSGSIIIVPVLLFISEKTYRIFLGSRPIKKIEILKEGVKLEIERTFRYLPGEYVFVNFPEINKLEWHPITISSCMSLNPENIELCIKSVGDWSSKVKSLCHSKDIVNIKIDGPYLSPCSRHVDYDNVIFIISGLGITPFISIIKDFAMKYAACENSSVFKKKMSIYWVSKSRDDLEWFEEIFADVAETVPDNILNINLYITESIDDPEVIKDISLGRMETYDTINKGIYMNYSRPNFNKILSGYSSKRSNITVGTFICGNSSITKSAIEAVKKYSNKNVSFEPNVEIF